MRERALVVEDDPAMLEACAEVLQQAYDVIKAPTGEAAQSIVRREAIDVAVVDLRMPSMGGLDVLRIAKDVDPEIAVVLITANAASTAQGSLAATGPSSCSPAAALVLLALAAWLVLRFRPPVNPPIASLAVLPLANLSGDPQQEYFADGMTDALITSLASIGALRVISRQSVMRYKASRDSLPEIARRLGVDAVIEGSVVRSGDRVRVTAQLVHGSTDRHLWARSYDRSLGDVLGLQGELAGTIADEVRVQVTSEERRRLAGPRVVGTAAYDAYLRGRHFWARRDKEGLNKAVGYFEQAIAADPAFALAYAGLAESYGPMGYSGFLSPAEATPRMKAAALKAVELGPELAEAHTALAACLAFHEWQWAPAESEFKRAIELNPGYTAARAWYALYLHSVARDEEALGQNLTALKNDPLSLTANWSAAFSLGSLGRTDEAIEQYRKTLELDSRFYRARLGLATLYAATGDHEQALSEM